ncbi:gustatory receptor for sugar taste 64a-like [Zophobas morio]|uniref:gustatory receptor for sugar taste 64a-like n=1 Tax=Zophobas morio TaxID=2755281 RepID=UPI003082D710
MAAQSRFQQMNDWMQTQRHIGVQLNNESKKLAVIIHFANLPTLNVEIQSVAAKAILHFTDLFIVVIAFALKTRFTQITKRILRNSQNESAHFWQTIREDYNRMAQLVELLNNHFSNIILCSLGFNCFWVMKLLYNSLKYCILLNNESKKPSFIIQFSDLPTTHNVEIESIIGKTVVHFTDLFIVITALSLKARFRHISRRISANIRKKPGLCFWQSVREDYDQLVRFVRNCIQLNNESKKPAFIIQFCDVPIDNVEVMRLLKQIEFDSVYFSGNRLFQIKNGIVLSVAGAIVTYELTLFQGQMFYRT